MGQTAIGTDTATQNQVKQNSAYVAINFIIIRKDIQCQGLVFTYV